MAEETVVEPPPKKKRWKPTGHHVGRPSKAELASRFAEAKRLKHDRKEWQRARARLSRAERSKNWGGRRAGAGRPREANATDGLVPVAFSARLEPELAEQIKRLPRGKVSAYIRAAVDLMKDLAPPEKFLASGKEKAETGAVY
jgi:hypothetical protein